MIVTLLNFNYLFILMKFLFKSGLTLRNAVTRLFEIFG